MSSIFMILRTVSAASETALVDTSNGCRTFSSRMLVMVPYNNKHKKSNDAECLHKLDYIFYYIILFIMGKIMFHFTFLTFIPAVFSPCACLFRRSVTVAIGLSPAFSASVKGMTSSASANARMQYASIPVSVRAYSAKRIDTSISGAPPPAMSALKKQV